jgi:arabinoxylan arabinofuranohydrolase
MNDKTASAASTNIAKGLGALARPFRGKAAGDHNPLIAQRYSADPNAFEYRGRIYVYSTADQQEYAPGGELKDNSFKLIRSLNLVSSADLANWTDHGRIDVAGPAGPARWAGNSWAPAIAMKNIGGKDRFFLYFADSGGGIGVLAADDPTGPFTDPIGGPLVSRKTPNCSDVVWLFDPAVLVDDDGRAYLYFGGGVPEGKEARPGTARVIELGPDMISLIGEARPIDVPWLFEDSGINKVGATYVYTYCSNWSKRPEPAGEGVPGIAQIVQMRAPSPMGPFEYAGPILKNPGEYFGGAGNNHHAIVALHGGWYMFYHSFVLQDGLGRSGGYRSVHADRAEIGSDGLFRMIAASASGLPQDGFHDPYRRTSAGTMAWWGGEFEAICYPAVEGMKTGDWIGVSGVDFGDRGSEALIVKARAESCGNMLAVYLGGPQGPCVGWLELPVCDKGAFIEARAEVERIRGVHDLFFLAGGSGIDFESWRFLKA